MMTVLCLLHVSSYCWTRREKSERQDYYSSESIR